MILSLIRSVLRRCISPASGRLHARFLRRGVPPPLRDLRRNLRKSLPCQCFGPWSLDKVYAFAWFFPARPLRPPTHGERISYQAGVAIVGACEGGCIWDIDGTWNAPIAHATQAYLRTVTHKKSRRGI